MKASAVAVLKAIGSGRNLRTWIQMVSYFTDKGSGSYQGSERADHSQLVLCAENQVQHKPPNVQAGDLLITLPCLK